jgi:uncharacterized protein (DUF983 family)
MLEERWAADDGLPDEDDWPDEGNDGLAPCPYCGADILEDSPRCPSCGKYLSEEDRPPEKKPPWILIGIVLCLIIALAWAAGR